MPTEEMGCPNIDCEAREVSVVGQQLHIERETWPEKITPATAIVPEYGEGLACPVCDTEGVPMSEIERHEPPLSEQPAVVEALGE